MIAETRPAAAPAPEQRAARLVEFVEPIPGFEDERDFSLAAIDAEGTLFSLRSLRTPQLRFVVMPPAGFFPDYEPAVNESDVAPLGDVADVELQLLVIVSVKDGIADATANLLAPIVMIPENGRAMQVVLDDPRLPLHAPLLPLAS
ncbi:flagellar assembly protein FliW [Jatrophihabitans telluris]|uniref:Flagellar assembly factor FliW n=1 Tax=Jatrophihabitans telluris TaxID=2038343 RepID=A0ABY4QY73_9ACTN|nr:flagellar assembly protein FliW [Jatrophihabitans telluris]UQX87936.1 flagellar assembly protein FliW [Jatrophihabitans telluris]